MPHHIIASGIVASGIVASGIIASGIIASGVILDTGVSRSVDLLCLLLFFSFADIRATASGLSFADFRATASELYAAAGGHSDGETLSMT